MATYSVQFYLFHDDGNMLEDQGVHYIMQTTRELRKAEMVAKLSQIGLLEPHGNYVYAGIILPVSLGNDGITELGYYNVDTEAEYSDAVRRIREQNDLPAFGIVFRNHLEKA
jgi:hypothetical protein